MIDNTLYLSEESKKKQVNMPNWAYETLKMVSGPSLSKGLAAYEVLMLTHDEYTDSLSEIESNIDDSLPGASGQILNTLEKRNNSRNASYKTQNATRDDPNHIEDRVNIYLPKGLIQEQIPIKRGIGHHIADAVEEWHPLVWGSRTERILVKQQLLKLADGESVSPDHKVVEAVIDNDSSEVSCVDELRVELGLDDRDWWKQEDVTVEKLKQKGDEIPQKPRSARTGAIEDAIINADDSYTPSEVRHLIRTVFGLKSERTIKQYMSEIEVQSMVPINWVSNYVSGIAEQAREKTGKFANKSDAWVVGFRPEITSIDGTYSKDVALDQLEEAKKMTLKVGGERKRAQRVILEKIEEDTKKIEQEH